MNTKDAAVAVAATGFKRMTRRQWLGACLLAILAGCNGTPSTVDAPKQATDDTENTNMSTEPSQPRDSVPLTRPLSLSTEAGTQRWEFEVGPPGENSGSSLILGFRMCLLDAKQSIAAESELYAAPPTVEIHLRPLGETSSLDVTLSTIEMRGTPPKPELVEVPVSGKLSLVQAASPDRMAMIEAGLDQPSDRCTSFAFARAMSITPGRYALSLRTERAFTPPEQGQLELLVAYTHRGI